jgi:hemolysin activation/secretion protein
VLFRSGVTRLTAGILGRYSDVGNFLEDNEIRVSTYQLRTAGMRLDYTQKLGRWELGTILTWEKGTARGPAADLPGGGSVAGRQYERSKLYVSLLRPFRFLNGSVQLRLNNQYSPDQLYSSEQFSLTAEVGGYEEIAFTGNSGSSAVLEISTNHGLYNTSLRPWLRWETGLIPDYSNEAREVRLSAATAGLAVHRGRMSLTLESTWPRSGSSTEEARNDHVARAALQWSW